MTRSEAREADLKRKVEDMASRTREAVKTCVRNFPDNTFETPQVMDEVCSVVWMYVVDLSSTCSEVCRLCHKRV